MPTPAARSGITTTAGPTSPAACFPAPAPLRVLAAGRLYFAAGWLDASTPPTAAPSGPSSHQKFAGRGADFGYACSPVVEDGLVILPSGSSASVVRARRQHRSDTLGRRRRPRLLLVSGADITFRGRRQVVAFFKRARRLRPGDRPPPLGTTLRPRLRRARRRPALPRAQPPHDAGLSHGSDLCELKPTRPRTPPHQNTPPQRWKLLPRQHDAAIVQRHRLQRPG